MQAFSHWAPPQGTLGRIVAEATGRVEALSARRAELERRAADVPAGPSLAAALRGAHVAILAEVKRRSPSKGLINPGADAATQARAYELGGARGISVLTEPVHFGGSAADLLAVRAAVRLPVLKKDFHVDPLQLLEARGLGASAILLIARALEPTLLATLAGTAEALGLEVLIEIRDEAELERALATTAQMIGVNNRDLESLAIDASTSERLLPLIPPTRIGIAESGVTSRGDVERAATAGADAVLVGSSLSAADDAVAAVHALGGVARRER